MQLETNAKSLSHKKYEEKNYSGEMQPPAEYTRQGQKKEAKSFCSQKECNCRYELMQGLLQGCKTIPKVT